MLRRLQNGKFKPNQGRLAQPLPRIHGLGRCQRRTGCIVAFTDGRRRGVEQNSTVLVPKISNFELLGLDRAHCSTEDIKKAYEERLTSQTQAAYSADTLFSRAVLLKSAVECLLDPQRSGMEQRLTLGSPGLKVFQSDLPGVLVVLQEVGCHSEVLSLGPSWLEAHGSSPDAPDVAACIALAYCDRASLALDALEQGGTPLQGSQAGPSSPLLSACEDLERAAQLCRLHDVAYQLQEQIADALKGYTHAYARELVSLPLGPEWASRRKRGVAIIRSALRRLLSTEEDKSEQTAHADALSLLRTTRPHLTAREQHVLLQDLLASHALATYLPYTPASGPKKVAKVGNSPMKSNMKVNAAEGVSAGFASELYSGAMALVAEGIARAQPVLVAQADELLCKVEAFEASQAQPQMAVRLDRACCCVLLGRNPSVSLDLLGMPEVLQAAAARAAGSRGLKAAPATVRMHGPASNSSSGVEGPDWEACQYVLDRSPDAPDDLAPGLHALTQGWLCEAVLGGLREWQRPAATTSTATTTSGPHCLFMATAADQGSAESGALMATMVTSELGAYWFNKPLVALYAKAYPLMCLLPPLLGLLNLMSTFAERIVSDMSSIQTHYRQQRQQQLAAHEQAQREKSQRVKAAAAEAVAKRRQQEQQWKHEEESGQWARDEGEHATHSGFGGGVGGKAAWEASGSAEGYDSEEVEGEVGSVGQGSGVGSARSRLGFMQGLGQDGEQGVAAEQGPVHPEAGVSEAAGGVEESNAGPSPPSHDAETAVASGSMEQQLQQLQHLQHQLQQQELQEDEGCEQQDAPSAQALRGQLIEMEKAMWDSGAHVRMQRLMDDFHAKAATNTMMSGGPSKHAHSTLPPLHVLLPSLAVIVAAVMATLLNLFSNSLCVAGSTPWASAPPATSAAAAYASKATKGKK